MDHIRPFSDIPTLIPEFRENVFTGGVSKIERKLYCNGYTAAYEYVWLQAESHPHQRFDIAYTILNGWYKVREYTPNGSGGWVVSEVYMQEGDAPYDVSKHTRYQIYEVMPGTITLVTIWSVTEGEGSDLSVPDLFLAALQHLNPHMRPKLKDPEGRTYPSGVRDPAWVDVYAHFPVPTLNDILTSVGL